MQKYLFSVVFFITLSSMAMALKPNKITYDDEGIFTAGLGCFDEESCAFTAKAVEENPKLKPYTDYIGKPAEILVGKGANPDNFREIDDKGWPKGTLLADSYSSFLNENCSVGLNADKDLKTIIGIELMNNKYDACQLN